MHTNIAESNPQLQHTTVIGRTTTSLPQRPDIPQHTQTIPYTHSAVCLCVYAPGVRSV